MKLIKLIRARKGMNQSELAELIGVTQGVISSWENGLYAPSIAKLPELARILGCTVDELLEGLSTEKEKKQQQEAENDSSRS